jgi:hypothetical protein
LAVFGQTSGSTSHRGISAGEAIIDFPPEKPDVVDVFSVLGWKLGRVAELYIV